MLHVLLVVVFDVVFLLVDFIYIISCVPAPLFLLSFPWLLLLLFLILVEVVVLLLLLVMLVVCVTFFCYVCNLPPKYINLFGGGGGCSGCSGGGGGGSSGSGGGCGGVGGGGTVLTIVISYDWLLLSLFLLLCYTNAMCCISAIETCYFVVFS